MYWIGVNLDIEESKRAEFEQELLTKALRKSQQELVQILDLTPQLMAVFGPRHERLCINRIALDYLSVTLDEWLASGFGSDIHPDDLERLQTHWDRAVLDGTVFETEVRVRNGDGSYRWFLARYNSVRDDAGQVLRWYVACTDCCRAFRARERGVYGGYTSSSGSL